MLQCVFRVLDAHPASRYLVHSGLECLRAMAPGLSDPASALQLLGDSPVQALCRRRAPDRLPQLMQVTSALQTRMVSFCAAVPHSDDSLRPNSDLYLRLHLHLHPRLRWIPLSVLFDTQ